MYGSIALFPIFLIWLNLLWIIILVGFELCHYLEMRRLGIRYQDHHHLFDLRIVFDILEYLSELQKKGKRGRSNQFIKNRA